MNDSGSGNSSAGNERGHIRLAALDHDEYDALADLFLGEGGYAPVPISHAPRDGGDGSPGEPAEVRDPQTPSHATHTPVLHLTHTPEEAPLCGSGVAHGPDEDDVFRPESAGLRVLETLRATDDQAAALLAELLGQGADDEVNRFDADDDEAAVEGDATATIAMPGPVVEAVVLGHLPVRASLWARQYACSCARDRGEVVALVRAAAGSTAVDLITGEAPIGVQGSADLGSALATIHEVADRVILRVDEASEPELLDRPEVETITILTGADEAAVVASYRLIKTLDASLGERFSRGDAPGLRVAVMGAGREQALDARAKLLNAVETFISRPIEIVVGAGRIDATGTTNIYRDTIAHPASHIIEGLVRAAHGQASESGAWVEPASRDEPPVVHTLVSDASIIEPKPKTMDMNTSVSGAGQAAEAHAGHARGSGSPASRRAACEAESARVHEGLCVLIPGLRPIETRCPASPGVELAIDARGRLHLLACDADTDGAMKRLYVAQSWARDHLALLLRAEPGLAIPSADRGVENEAMMHLITPEPAAMRGLYETPVRVYALARVRVGRVVAQVATALN